MRFSDLNPKFYRHERREDGHEYYTEATIETAQGVHFLCPVCIQSSKKDIGCHRVMCWSESRGITPEIEPGPGRWTLEGTGIEDLTLGCEPNRSRSVLLTSSICKAHFFITNGEVQMA